MEDFDRLKAQKDVLMNRKSDVVAWVVKSHNMKSGKGSYALHGVFWEKEDAMAMAARGNSSVPKIRIYTVHKFVEAEAS